MKGVYVLLFDLPSTMELKIGSLGKIEFEEGRYAYTGSAQNGIESRTRRHATVDKKKHWHIDHLTVHGRRFSAIIVEGHKRMECELASRLSRSNREVPDFGCSDCRCNSHLFYLNESRKKIKRLLADMDGTYFEVDENRMKES